ncbi:MAG TPA: ABC transporter permease, partial [Candidatus Nanoarchaeia archaeon]|nr:ABC transporter permease [Candidatus Nanoarchaeia archaeon]
GSSTNVKQLSAKDLSTLKLVPGISAMMGQISGSASVYYNGETTSISIRGIDEAHFSDFVTTPIESGNYLNKGESRAIVIGNNVAHKVFKRPLQAGFTISINNTPFKIRGILALSSGIGGGGSDTVIYMPIKDAREILGSRLNLNANEFSSIQVKVSDPNFIQEASDKIEIALANSHHVTLAKKDFSLSSSLALQDRFSQITNSITIFLAVLAGISLLVGGIGVANTMFTSVIEKTKDIGVMKAIGAKNRDVLMIFLFNSGMLGMVGGIIGIMFGALIAYFLPVLGISIGNRGTLQTVLSFNLMAFSLGFSVIIGMVSGVIPAYRASKLKPVDALRHE